MGITIYSDGGGERGSAAAGACIIENGAGERARLAVFLGPGTNNEAEITAGLLGFSFLHARGKQGEAVRWVSDSEYTLKSATTWIYGWQRNGWKTSDKKPVKNQGLWQTFLILSKGLKITPEHVRGHTGHPENEACDSVSTWVQANGASALRGEGSVTIDPLGNGEPWLLLDGREFIRRLRSEGSFSPDPEAALLLVEQLERVNFTFSSSDTPGETTILPDSGMEAEALDSVFAKLREAQAAAKELGHRSEKADALAASIERLIKKYRRLS